MYNNILKRDLKRKKTMNIILNKPAYESAGGR